MKVRKKLRFTLTEILIVIAIIGMIVAAMLPNLASGMSEAQKGATQMKMNNIEAAIATFQGKHKRRPISVDELVSDPGNLKQPYKSFLKSGQVQDAWGNPFRVVFDEQLHSGVNIISNGPDGIEGNDDDLSSASIGEE